MVEFGKKLTKETEGKYILDIAPNALLGDQKAASELVQNGIVQMAIVANPVIENFNKDFAVLGLPYVYDSIEHQKDVFTSDALGELFSSIEDKGIKVVGASTAGSRNVYTSKPIETPADLAGLKIRVMQSNTMKKMIDYMGGVGTPMPQNEVYTGIQQGVIDGGENNEVTYVDLKHYEIAPYFSYTKHLMVSELIIIHTKTYDDMTAEHKEIFDRLIKETIILEFEDWNRRADVAKEEAIENGATFVDVDIKPFQDNIKPLHDEVREISDLTTEIYDVIRSFAK